MTLAVRTVRLQLLARSGAVLPGARVRAQLTDYQVDGADVVPLTWVFTEDPLAPGYYVAALWPNTRASGGTQYLITADSGELRMQAQLHTIPAGTGVAAITMMVSAPPWLPIYRADQAVSAANTFANAAGQSASRAGAALGAVLDGSATASASAATAVDAAARLNSYIDQVVMNVTFPLDLGLVGDPVIHSVFDLGSV